MNVYTARQRQSDKRWVFTCRRDGEVWPVGYCSGVRECPECGGHAALSSHEICPTCAERGFLILNEEERCPGHESELAARQHYTDYLLDHRLQLELEWDDDASHRCAVPGCDEHTKRYADLGGLRLFSLCYAHHTRETVARLFGVVGSYTSSW